MLSGLRDSLPGGSWLPLGSYEELREIHRASECALQCPQKPIGSLGEANLVSPRGFQKVITLIVNALVNFKSRGEFHETR